MWLGLGDEIRAGGECSAVAEGTPASHFALHESLVRCWPCLLTSGLHCLSYVVRMA